MLFLYTVLLPFCKTKDIQECNIYNEDHNNMAILVALLQTEICSIYVSAYQSHFLITPTSNKTLQNEISDDEIQYLFVLQRSS
jgi:hypothetical protein